MGTLPRWLTSMDGDRPILASRAAVLLRALATALHRRVINVVSIDSGNLDLPLTVLDQPKAGVVTVGGTPFVHTCCSPTNTFVGSNAGTNAGTFSIDGANNTGVGNQALNAIRNGDSNTAVGSLAMEFQQDGGSNTAIGASALELATATSFNTAIGENSRSSGQVLSWSGSAWVCTTISGGGTITGVTAGTDLTGGGTSGNVTLNVDTTKVPQLGTANSFAGTQTVNGLVAITGSGNGVQFPDGTLQTTAATGGGGIPSGFMILGSTSTAPPGYTLSGTIVSGNVASSVAPMITAREELGAATVSGKIYAIGGYNPTAGYLEVNEVYDPATNSWSTQKKMPVPRAYFAAAAASNGEIWAIGGTDGAQVTGTVEIYSTAGNNWSAGPKLPGAREGLAAAVYLNHIYAIGGCCYLTDFLASTNGGPWGQLKPMPSPRAYLAAAAVAGGVSGKIYAIGGYDGHSVLDTVEVYDIHLNTWTAAAPMPTARRDLAAVVLNNKIYAIGGSDGQSSLNLVEVYDPSTNIWSTAPSPLAARSQFGAVAVNGFVYLMGGAAGTNILGTVEQYSPAQTLYTFTKN